MSFIPPLNVARNAQEALAWREAGVRAGTAVGWARARQLAGREPVTERTLKRMTSYFARHAGDRLDRDGRDGKRPSNGWVMWQAWGGDSGRAWATRKLAEAPNPQRIARVRPSLPARWLKEHGCIKGRVLDYGSGYGEDARSYGWNEYDPVTHPARPRGKFRTILATYVLNIIPPKIRKQVLRDIVSHLSPGGVAFVTVRRDIASSSRGPTQWWVRLPYPVIRRTSAYEIYILQKKF